MEIWMGHGLDELGRRETYVVRTAHWKLSRMQIEHIQTMRSVCVCLGLFIYVCDSVNVNIYRKQQIHTHNRNDRIHTHR